ncbi:MAG: ABC transporter permease [Deltaproteobacteria bacterium]|nr:ABC transporter permease [Deltaproteobacteria bacterium]
MSSLTGHIAELIKHRHLIGHLVSKELKVRYRGSVLGFMWTFLNPLLLLSVYALVFSVYMRIEMDNYAAFMFTGLLPWIWVQSSLAFGTNAITEGQSLVTKVIFPLQVLPTVKVAAALVNYILGLPILIGFLWLKGIAPSFNLLLLPLVVLGAGLLVWGLALILSTTNVFLRDTQYIIANLLTLWFFVTPILYPLSQVPAPFRPLVRLNPLTLVMGAFQDIFFYRRLPNLLDLAALFLVGLVAAGVGMLVFDRYKESFAEMV